MPVNITDVDTFTDPIVAPADSDPADATYVRTIAQGTANRTRNLKNRLEDIEDQISGGEWVYPGASFRTRTIELLPSDFEQANNTANNIPWRFRPSVGNAQTVKSGSSERAELVRQLNRLIPGNGVVTNIWVMVTPGAARSGVNKLSAQLYSREPTVYTPGSEALGSVALMQSVSDDGGTGLQSLLLNSGADMTLGYAIWLHVSSGSGDTTDDLFHGVKIEFQDYGPINY